MVSVLIGTFGTRLKLMKRVIGMSIPFRRTVSNGKEWNAELPTAASGIARADDRSAINHGMGRLRAIDAADSLMNL